MGRPVVQPAAQATSCLTSSGWVLSFELLEWHIHFYYEDVYRHLKEDDFYQPGPRGNTFCIKVAKVMFSLKYKTSNLCRRTEWQLWSHILCYLGESKYKKSNLLNEKPRINFVFTEKRIICLVSFNEIRYFIPVGFHLIQFTVTITGQIEMLKKARYFWLGRFL